MKEKATRRLPLQVPQVKKRKKKKKKKMMMKKQSDASER
jgi:hypothetical protein